MADSNRRRLYCLLADYYKGKFFEDYFEDSPYRKIYRKIYFETFRHLSFIEKVVNSFITKDTSIELYSAVVLGTAQILFIDDVPAYAAVNESVSLVKKGGRGFVNAILRKVINDKDNILKSYTIYEDFPDWIMSRYKKILKDQRELEMFFESLNTPPKNMCLNLKDFNWYAYDDYQDISADSIAMDVGSGSIPLLTKHLKPKQILDACAAPGGKSVILSRLHKDAVITAVEKDKLRFEKLESNINKYNCENVRAVLGDVLKLYDEEKYDLILLDAPCSSLGTVRRHPEIKYIRTVNDLNKNSRIQYGMLEKMSELVEVNGVIIYSVCSLEPEEGVLVIEKFLDRYENFSLLPPYADEKFVSNGYYVTFPHKTGADGFFGAVIKKDA